jgi:hypothetical protein
VNENDVFGLAVSAGFVCFSIVIRPGAAPGRMRTNSAMDGTPASLMSQSM